MEETTKGNNIFLLLQYIIGKTKSVLRTDQKVRKLFEILTTKTK